MDQSLSKPDQAANAGALSAGAACPFIAGRSAAVAPQAAATTATLTTAPSTMAATVTPSASRPVRWLYLIVGLVCFGLAIAGALLPGLPTTVFVLAGSYCLTRSCPWIERRLMSTRLLSPYAKYLNPGTPFPRRARVMALAAMWCSIAVSVTVLAVAGRAPVWLLAVIVAAGLAGTVCILTFRRRVRAAV